MSSASEISFSKKKFRAAEDADHRPGTQFGKSSLASTGPLCTDFLVAVRTFLDLAPEKLLEEKIDAEGMRNPNFWKEFYEQAQVQIRRITALLTDLVIASERSDTPSLQESCLDETVAGSVEKLKGSLLQNGITVMNQIPAGLPALWVEREKFQRLFDLLLKDEIISLPPESHIFLNALLGSRRRARSGN